VGFLRRLRGGKDDPSSEAARREEPAGERWSHGVDDHLPDDEVERERALMRTEADRLDDDLIQRQLRYADRSWTPPRQGGEARSDDEQAGG
jgi:hypothetical protein